MQYEIIEEQIHIFLDADKTANCALWLAELLSTVLEEHPEVFVCHYNSDLVM